MTSCFLTLSTSRLPIVTLFPYTTLFRSNTAASSSGRFDEAALKSELEGMGYQCDDDDDCTKTEGAIIYDVRSEEHTSELQSRGHLVCRLLLEKKKKQTLAIYLHSVRLTV